jgi:hypothetical protein
MRVEEESAEAIVAKTCGKPYRAKGRRTTKQTIPTTFMDSPGVFRNGRTLPRWQPTGPVVERRAGGFRQEATPREASEATSG